MIIALPIYMEEEKEKKRGNKGFWLVILVIAVAIVVLWQTGVLAVGGGADGFQAVFLSNNQVYFGKLERSTSQYPVLKEVFYLQITQTLQPRDETAPPAQNVSLVKLGGELHGPEDAMVINRDHILFYEDLKADSQVTTAIKQFKESQGK